LYTHHLNAAYMWRSYPQIIAWMSHICGARSERVKYREPSDDGQKSIVDLFLHLPLNIAEDSQENLEQTLLNSETDFDFCVKD